MYMPKAKKSNKKLMDLTEKSSDLLVLETVREHQKQLRSIPKESEPTYRWGVTPKFVAEKPAGLRNYYSGSR